jgi:hypothetical protein
LKTLESHLVRADHDLRLGLDREVAIHSVADHANYLVFIVRLSRE